MFFCQARFSTRYVCQFPLEMDKYMDNRPRLVKEAVQMIWRLLVVVLSQLLVLQPVFAQQPPGPRALKIVVVDGAGSRNVVLQIAARPMTVRVEDAANRPVAGAEVVFTAPQA